MEISRLLKEVVQLNLPKDKYAITSSGSLAMRGIREANDLDLIVTSDLWDELREKYPVEVNGVLHCIKIGNIEIVGEGSCFTDHGIATAEQQISEADIIEGYPCVRLDYVSRFKLLMGREKDLRDIQFIDEYKKKFS